MMPGCKPTVRTLLVSGHGRYTGGAFGCKTKTGRFGGPVGICKRWTLGVVVGGAVGQGHGSEHSVQQLSSQHGAYSHEHKLRFFLRAVPGLRVLMNSAFVAIWF